MKHLALAVLCAVAAAQAADSLVTEPAKPNTRDSITFRVFLENNCCCTQYYNKGVTVEDTVIYLGHEFDTRPCAGCLCLLPGSWVEFLSGPVSQGTYAVYSAGQMYCPPGEMCAYGLMAPVRVGEITVVGHAAVLKKSPHVARTGRAPAGVGFALDGRPVGRTAPAGVVVEPAGALRVNLTR